MTTRTDRLGSRLKAWLLHQRKRQLSRHDWRARHHKVFAHNPAYRRPCAPEIEQQHRTLWRPLRSSFGIETLRVCHGISGKAVPEIIPEEVYVSEIEPCLNRHSETVFLANKNFYNRWFADGTFPKAYLHNIEGDFYSGEYRPLSPAEVNSLIDQLPYPVVVKPSVGPGGGRGVYFVRSPKELAAKIADQQNFVVQELINQQDFFARFNSTCLNTLRVCTYRSVADNQVHVLNVTMRMGKGGSLDNETAGGIVCNLHEDGTLNDYAVDKYGVKFFEHPDTHLRFADGYRVPALAQLHELARRAAQDIYLARLASLDATMDRDGRWRLIELNLFAQTIRFAQYAGKPFFGRFTAEVIGYCRDHPRWR